MTQPLASTVRVSYSYQIDTSDTHTQAVTKLQQGLLIRTVTARLLKGPDAHILTGSVAAGAM